MRLLVCSSLIFLCLWSTLSSASDTAEFFPKPTVKEFLFYHLARRFDLITASKNIPQKMQRPAYRDISLEPLGIKANNVTLLLGIQPNHHLAKKLLKQASNAQQQLTLVSILAPFEAEHTSKLIPPESIMIINGKDNEGLTPEAITSGVKALHQAITQGNTLVYLHCKSGIGRSLSIFSAYLIEKTGMSLERALLWAKALRPHTQINSPKNCHYKALQSWQESLVPQARN